MSIRTGPLKPLAALEISLVAAPVLAATAGPMTLVPSLFHAAAYRTVAGPAASRPE